MKTRPDRPSRSLGAVQIAQTPPEKPIDVALAGRMIDPTVHRWARFDARAGALAVPRPDRFHLSPTRKKASLVNRSVGWARTHQTPECRLATTTA